MAEQKQTDGSQEPTRVQDLGKMASLSAAVPAALEQQVSASGTFLQQLAAENAQRPNAANATSCASPGSLQALADLAATGSSRVARHEVIASQRRVFVSRLLQEVSRAERGVSLVSVVLVQLPGAYAKRSLAPAAAAIGETLRDYDLCSRIGAAQLGVILPGATADGCWCAIERMRDVLAEREVQFVAIGGATWTPADWSAESLLRRAAGSGIASGAVPRDRSKQPQVMLWSEELAHAVPVEAGRSSAGLMVSLPLPFARVGASVYLTGSSGYRFSGTVQQASVDQSGQPTVRLKLT